MVPIRRKIGKNHCQGTTAFKCKQYVHVSHITFNVKMIPVVLETPMEWALTEYNPQQNAVQLTKAPNVMNSNWTNIRKLASIETPQNG